VHRYDGPMSFLSILFALLLEQVKPLSPTNAVHSAVRNWVRWVMGNFDAGKPQHGWLAWGLAVLVPCAIVLAVHWALVGIWGWWAAALWNIAMLYTTLGFRQFSHHFTQVRDALHAGDEDSARAALAQWQRKDTRDLPRPELVRQVIEHSVLSAHRHVFGVFAWYTLLAALGFGPAGAVFYRVSEYVGGMVQRPAKAGAVPLGDAVRDYAVRAWSVVDWAPARVTAMSFAFVGSFEEAVDSWRKHEALHPLDNDGVVLAATAGAVNVRLGDTPADDAGQQPELGHLRAVVGLVWRTVVMWMVFLALLSLARLIG
jgi:adenosylcobinamide-phosphate synthase